MNVDFLVSTKNNCKMVKNVTKFKSIIAKLVSKVNAKGNLEIYIS